MARPRIVLAVLALAACEPAASGAARRADTAAVPGAAYVDTARTMDEHVRRFRATIDHEPTRLEGGETSRDTLVRRFAEAVAGHDTLTLRRLHLTRAEFAYLYFPTNPAAKPPYELDPALLWFRISGETEKGMERLLPRYGGPGFRLLGYECPSAPLTQGENRLWAPCVTRVRSAAGDTLALALFGPIIERGGRFKFVSYANKL